ncbi:hypothetical protein [Kineococcus sp. SYSU DK003]|uniref:hypothetical protein n=1 Tax=Kineococcus sp. SYSU DK003 TaxID=3383124 RepID=UPI003D7CEB0C
MRISIDPAAVDPAELLERDEFTSFDVAVPPGTTVAELSAVLGSVGELDALGEDLTTAHVRVSVEWLRQTAHAEGADGAWDEQFEGMLAHAEGRGWVEGGTVRAHVVEL